MLHLWLPMVAHAVAAVFILIPMLLLSRMLSRVSVGRPRADCMRLVAMVCCPLIASEEVGIKTLTTWTP